MSAQSRELPRMVQFITDQDCGYTLDEIHTVLGTSLIYGELRERPTDEHPRLGQPVIAIMRSPAELPTEGRQFSPEIVTEFTRGTNVLRTGRVEAVTEDPPSRLIGRRLRRRVDAFLDGDLERSDNGALRADLAELIGSAMDELEQRECERREEGHLAAGAVPEDFVTIPTQWRRDLATARQVIDEIDESRSWERPERRRETPRRAAFVDPPSHAFPSLQV
jgi:hypothetical protein